MVQYLRSLLFTTILAITVFPCGAWVILTAPFGRSASYLGAIWWVRINFWFARVICGLHYDVSGTENIPEENSVVYLKHSSTWETMAEILVFPEQVWVLKRELYWLPYFGWALALLRPIGIDRGARSSAVKQVIRKGRKFIHNGLWVMIFPEGTRVAPGATRRFGLSGALLAIDTNRKIVPVAHNACDFWPRHSMLRGPGTIKLIVGPPIETSGRDAEEVNDQAKTWIDQTMREISTAYSSSVEAASAANIEVPACRD